MKLGINTMPHLYFLVSMNSTNIVILQIYEVLSTLA